MTVLKGNYTYLKLLCLLLPIMFLFSKNILNVTSFSYSFKDWIIPIVTLIGLSKLFMQFIKRPHQVPILSLLFLFVICSIFPTFWAYSDQQFTWIVFSFAKSVFWVAAFTIAYKIGQHDANAIMKSHFVILFIPIFAYLFWTVKEYFLMNSDVDTAMTTVAYYSLMLLPFALLIHNKLIKFTLILIILATVLLSVKRTAFLALVLSLIVSFFVEIKVNNKKNVSILYVIAASFLLYFFLVFFVEEMGLSLFNRLASIKEDQGSGRMEIWVTTWNMILDSNFLTFVFGHGYDMVYWNTPFQMSAHTDILEVIYDYGIIGVIIYALFYKILFDHCRMMYQMRSHLCAPFAGSLVLALVFSLTSHLIIFPTYFIFLCVFWGLSISSFKCSFTSSALIRSK